MKLAGKPIIQGVEPLAVTYTNIGSHQCCVPSGKNPDTILNAVNLNS